MRVLHLSTSSSGGAGISATRIVESEKSLKVEAKLIDRQTLNGRTNLLRLVEGKALTVFQKSLSLSSYDLLTPLSLGVFPRDILETFRPDVLHIHNWYNLLSIGDLKDLAQKYPVVFTMHDMRLATGGCHVTLECKNYLTGCDECPAFKLESIVRHSKERLSSTISKFNNFALVAPSNWLLQQINDTELYRSSKFHEVIENPVYSGKLVPSKKISKPSISCLFVAASLDSHFKGLPMLLESLRRFREKYSTNIQINLVGSTLNNYDHTTKTMRINTLGPKSQEEVANLMMQADFLLVPSLSDNKPGVIREAQLLGLPVIATNIGGIPEMITNGRTGYLAEAHPHSFAETIFEAINCKNTRIIVETAKADAQECTDPQKIASKYISLYGKLLENA